MSVSCKEKKKKKEQTIYLEGQRRTPYRRRPLSPESETDPKQATASERNKHTKIQVRDKVESRKKM